MEQYSYHEETGKITLEKKAVQNSENAGKSIYLMSLDEFLSHPRKLVRKNNFIHSMTPIQYCKIEKYRECVQGTMRVPKGNKGQVCIHNFGFYLSEQELYLVEESHFLMEYLNKMAEGTYEGYSFRQILLALFEELLQDEVLYLQKQEEHLAGLEEELLKKIPDYFYEMIMKYRKRFNIFHAYYEQLMNMGDVMQTSVNGGLSEEEKAQWQLFSNRAERLHDHVEMLREYLVQIRELYQSLIAVQQNQVMSILTVVTTIFLPLTLIAGWYGMNFPNMPEFGWKYAYPAVIIVSILVIILEIIYFKKRRCFRHLEREGQKIMMNPANIMKIMNAKNKFTANHPKFVAFLSAVFSREMEEGTVIEITLTRPGEEPMTTNMKIQQSDLDLMRELQDMAKNQ